MSSMFLGSPPKLGSGAPKNEGEGGQCYGSQSNNSAIILVSEITNTDINKSEFALSFTIALPRTLTLTVRA